MKTFYFSLILFIIVFALIVSNSYFLNVTLGALQTSLKDIPLPAEQSTDLSLQLSLLREIEKTWYQKIFLYSLTISHQDLMEVEQQLSAVIGAAAADSRENYIVSLYQLDYALSHLSAMSRLTLQNVF
jgi:hypothetical protein